MTEEQEQEQMDVVKPNDDTGESSLHTLIEKVVNDEIKKLASTTGGLSEVIKLVSVNLESSSITEATAEGISMEEEPETTSTNLDKETVLSTNVPAIETETIKAETMSSETTESLPNEENPIKVSDAVETTTNRLQADENVIGENGISSDSLLSAVSDLLSSILGLDDSHLKKNPDGSLPVDESLSKMQSLSTFIEGNSIATTTEDSRATTNSVDLEASSDAPEIEQGTEKLYGTTPVGYEGEQSDEEELTEKEIVPLKISSTALNAFKDKVVSEIDLKIENLASSQTSLTESTPEQVTETVRDENVNVLEVISEPSSDEGFQPVSFDDSVNQVMNLVKAAEEQPTLGDSVLVDKNMKDEVIDLDDVVYGTLKEIEQSLGIEHENVQGDELSHEVVDLKAEDLPSFENVDGEIDFKELQAKPEGIEIMKELEENLQKQQEDLKLNEIPENTLMKELETNLEMHRPMILEPVEEHRVDLIQALLDEINESMIKEQPVVSLIPNSAKAALHYRQVDMDEDF